MNSLFATTAQGLEELLKSELETLRNKPRQRLPQFVRLHRQRQRPCQYWWRAQHHLSGYVAHLFGVGGKNLRSNDLVGRQHRLIHADCLAWLSMAQETFDVIFIDPPTFSNSKRMADTFDVQRDHVALMAELKQLLRPDGTIMFSNNRRGFQLNDARLTALSLRAQSITDRTHSPDFTRNRQIHHCWLISLADKDL